jgi:transcriptional regulator with XRE-family HTH domain
LPTGKRTTSEPGMITPATLRAARALVGWSREKLAEEANVATETVKRFELRGSDPKQSTLQTWKRALGAAGVEFLEPTDDGKGEGVRFRKAKR